MARKMPFNAQATLQGGGLEGVIMTFPGLIQDALATAGHIDIPEVGLPSPEHAALVAQPWELTLTAPMEGFTDREAFLELTGICGQGELRVAGQWACRFASGDLIFEVTPFLNPDMEEMSITLAFDPPDKQHHYLSSAGLLGGALLHGISHLAIEALHVHPSFEESQVTVTPLVSVRVKAQFTFSYALLYGTQNLGIITLQEELEPGEVVLTHHIPVDELKRWQVGGPNTLYTLRLTITRRGIGCDQIMLNIGFRSLETTTTRFSGRSLLSAINGRPITLRGAVDPLPLSRARTQSQQLAQLDRLVRAHFNCIRVVDVRSNAFYDACDTRGILVWQQLPPEPDQAKAVLSRLIHRACIVIWSLPPMEDQPNRPVPLTHLQVQAIAKLLAQMHDSRPFLGVSPGGPRASESTDEVGRKQAFDVTGPDTYLGPDWSVRYPNLDDAYIRTMSPYALVSDRRVRQRAGNHSLWTNAAPKRPLFDPEVGADWMSRPLEDRVYQVRLSRFLQAFVLGYAAQRARARQAAGFFAAQAFERYAGLESQALVEYSGFARPAFFALSDAFAPIAVAPKLDKAAFWVDTHGDIFVHLMVDQPDLSLVAISATLYEPDGSVYVRQTWQVTLASGAMPLWRVKLPSRPGVLLLRLEVHRGQALLCRNDTLLSIGVKALFDPLIRLPETTLERQDGNLVNTGETIAAGVCCDGYEDPVIPGWGALLPGESHPVRDQARIEALNVSQTLWPLRRPD